MCLLFLICSWLFMKLQQKCLKKSLMAFQCHDWDTKFSYQINYFWIFMKLQQKTWRNIYLHFNAKTVIQHCLLTLVLFVTFQCRVIKYFTHCMDFDVCQWAAEWEGRPGLPDRSGLRGIVLSVGRFWYSLGPTWSWYILHKNLP